MAAFQVFLYGRFWVFTEGCMTEAKSQRWYQLYASALVELDPRQHIERVEATEAAIHGRLRDLQYDSDHHEERQRMADAQHTLAVLRRCP